MSDILCSWLNTELALSRKVDQLSFAKEFSNAYLIGEVLCKHQLQDDFDQFSQTYTADSKLNNFMRIEPTLNLLGVPFDTNIARDIMTESHGVANRLMYQLFIALNNKKKSNLTGIAMETMRAAAPAKLETIESVMYQDRLKQKTPRQTDMNLDALVARFQEKRIKLEGNAFKEYFIEQENLRLKHMDERKALIERSRHVKAKQTELLAKIEAATVEIPKPPSNRNLQAIRLRKHLMKEKISLETQKDIWEFEEKMNSTIQPSKPLGPEEFQQASEDVSCFQKTNAEMLDSIRLASNDEYIGKIRRRLQEDASAREEREKRRRKVLVDQMKAHEAQEEARREEMLVNRVMRQSQQERRIAVQLLQTRHEKEVIRKNRMIREQQYESRRAKDFEDALDKEAQVAKMAKQEYEEQTRKDKILHDQIASERAKAKYEKHYDICAQTLSQIVDFSCKVAEYRELTENLIPEKLWRDWKTLFLEGKPLFDSNDQNINSNVISPEEVLEAERQKLLDETDFIEYNEMIGEWCPPEGTEISGPPRNNPIVGHIVKRLYDMVHPPSPPPPMPEFPPFPIKACILGKEFSGKSTCLKTLMQNMRVEMLVPDDLVVEAIKAHKDGEVEVVRDEFEEETISVARSSMTTPHQHGVGSPDVLVSTGVNAEVGDVVPQDQSRKPVANEDSNKAADNEDVKPDATLIHNQVEKSDAEKPVTDEDGVDKKSDGASIVSHSPQLRSKSQASVKTQPTERAKLGLKASKCLKKGKPVDDQIVVDIIVEVIRRLSEGTGWILDGYPTTYAQAKLLEKALSGFDAGATTENVAVTPKAVRGGKRSSLVPDPRPPSSPPDPVSGINVVIVFDVPDEMCLKRSAGRMYAIQTDEVYQQEFKPPPDGSMTGINKQEKVEPVTDVAHDQEQVQHRITSFADNWPKIEKWFNKFGILRNVDASLGKEVLYLETEKILEDVLAKLEGKQVEESNPVEQSQVTPEPPKEEVKPPESGPAPLSEDPPKSPEGKQSRSGSRKSKGGSGNGSGKGSPSHSKSPKSKKEGNVRDGSAKRGGSGKKSLAKSPTTGGKGSAKRGRSGKKSKSPEIEPDAPVEPEEPQGPPPPEPGSEEWVFVNLPIELELAEVLATNWDTVEGTYIENSKVVFRNVREERENLIRYFFKIKKDYLEYLHRPDSKQEFVTQWQNEYNNVADDTRQDEETRCELHERVDDLRERLWSICDERKEQAEEERTTIMNDGWLEDKLGILSNHYITLMQSELDRFQDTLRLLKDYYRGMDGHIPQELKEEYARISLIDLPPTERADSPARSVAESTDETHIESGSRGKSTTPSGSKRKSKDEKTPEPGEPDKGKIKIPLVPRRALSPDPNAAMTGGKGGKDKDKKKKQGDELESPTPPADPDEKLLFDGHWHAFQAIHSMLAAEQVAREAEEEAEKQQELDKQKDAEKISATAKKGKDGGKGKGGKKSRSPSPKKGNKKDNAEAATPTTPVEEVSVEEKAKKEAKEKKAHEYYFTIEEEAQACRTRLELVKARGISLLQDLKNKADNSFKSMNDWLGARFLKEMESIDFLSEVMRHHIECGENINHELKLQQEDFLFNTDLQVVKTPSPLPPLSPIEQPTSEQFTVEQLVTLYNQFSSIAPEGVLSSKAFIEMFQDMTTVTHGMESLPEGWMTVTPNQLQDITAMISPDSEYIDWRAFLLTVSHPWPRPTQVQLLECLGAYQEMDQKRSGYVSKEQFDRVEFWFTPTSVEEGEYDRIGHLKNSFFDFFAEHTMTPPLLNYVDMLMYFAVSNNPYEGFLRALSIASGTHMPRIPKKPALKEIDSSAEFAYEDHQEEDAGPAFEDEVPASSMQAKVPIDSLLQVFHHGERHRGDSHRFAVSADPEDTMSRERIAGVYQELDSERCSPVQLMLLMEHPVIQDILSSFNRFKAPDLRQVIGSTIPDNADAQSMKTSD